MGLQAVAHLMQQRSKEKRADRAARFHGTASDREFVRVLAG